jgi:hypothetical protein
MNDRPANWAAPVLPVYGLRLADWDYLTGMKTQYFIALAAGLMLAGCGKTPEQTPPKPATNTPAVSGNPITAPVDYLGAVAKAKHSADRTIELVSLKQAVQQFQVAEGRLPKDLNELVTEKYLPSIPKAPTGMKIEYDAASGEVKMVAQ